MIIDFHSHILPGIDDGSSDAAISVRMLEEEARQGADLVFATPHLYPGQVDLGDFLYARDRAKQCLLDEISRKDLSLPKIIFGAEVGYFSGISRSSHIESLCMENSKLILVEMPFDSWSHQMVDEIFDLADAGYAPILAHVERYLAFDKNADFLNELAEDVYMQINAHSFAGFFKRKPLLKMIKNDFRVVLGTDAHDMVQRKPCLDIGRNMICKALGPDYLQGIDAGSEEIIKRFLPDLLEKKDD